MRMSRAVFIAGTDTGIGKTHVACALLHALRARHVGLADAGVGAGDEHSATHAHPCAER